MDKYTKIESRIQYAKSPISSISVEGVNLPNKPLTNFQLIDTIKRLKIPHFRGVFMRNDFTSQTSKTRMWNTKSRRRVW